MGKPELLVTSIYSGIGVVLGDNKGRLIGGSIKFGGGRGVILLLPPRVCSWVLEENLELSLHGEVLSSLVRD